MLPRHGRVRPPFELRLPPRADRDDRYLGQPPLDRRAEPQLRPQRGQPPSRARCRDKRVERPGQAALRGQDQVAPPVDDAIPQLLPLGPQFLTSHIRNPAHSPNNNQCPRARTPPFRPGTSPVPPCTRTPYRAHSTTPTPSRPSCRSAPTTRSNPAAPRGSGNSRVTRCWSTGQIPFTTWVKSIILAGIVLICGRCGLG